MNKGKRPNSEQMAQIWQIHYFLRATLIRCSIAWLNWHGFICIQCLNMTPIGLIDDLFNILSIGNQTKEQDKSRWREAKSLKIRILERNCSAATVH